MDGRTTAANRRRTALGVMWRTARHGTPAGEPGVAERLRALPRMLGALARGEYREAGVLRLLLAAAAAGYVLSPLDPMPEALLGLLGTVDDAVVAAWVAGTVLSATGDFLRWERTTAATVPGEVLD